MKVWNEYLGKEVEKPDAVVYAGCLGNLVKMAFLVLVVIVLLRYLGWV